jgi:hypothetical protein
MRGRPLHRSLCDGHIRLVVEPASQTSSQVAEKAAPVSGETRQPTAAQPKLKPLYIVELNDGTKIECVSMVDVNGDLMVKTTAGETPKINAADVKAKTPVK